MQNGETRQGSRPSRRGLLPPAFFTAFTLLVFARVLPHLSSSSAAAWDTSQMVWNLWWMKYALVDLHADPFFTDHVFHPNRLSLLFHTFTPLYGLLSIPVQLVCEAGRGPVLSFNLLLMASFVLAGWFSYLLVLRETHSQVAAYAAGTFYAFSSFHLSAVDQLNTASIQWLPLALYLLLRVLDAGRGRDAIAFGATFFVQLFTDYMVAVQLCVACGLVFLWTLAQEADRGKQLRKGAVLVAGCAPALLILLLLALQVRGESRWPVEPDPEFAVHRSADVVGFMLPGPEHFPYGPLVGAANEAYPKRAAGQPLDEGVRGRIVFLGYAPVLCALAALVFGRSRRRFMWLTLVGVFLWLSVGPVAHFYGERYGGVPSLYSAFAQLPFVGLGKTPYRFVIGASLGIAVLAGAGLAGLREAVRRRSPAGGAWLVAMLVGAIGLEALALLPRVPLEFNGATRLLAEDPRPGAVVIVDQSSFILGEAAMFQQVLHGRPIDFGYVARFHPGLAFPNGAPPREVLERLRRASQNRVFRFAVSPRLEAPGSLRSGERDSLEDVARWLRANAARRTEQGEWVVWELW